MIEEHRKYFYERSKNTLENFFHGLERDINPHEQVLRFTENTSHDYSNRIVLELIQNAYDALRVDSESRIKIELNADYGEHGALYIANTGNPFLKDNVKAICEMALSSKKPNENVGNKGIGFRSVLMISDYPEIYSMDSDNPSLEGFNGYCFSFANDDDIGRFCTDLKHAKQKNMAVQKVSRYSLPVAIESQNEEIIAYARDGYATVIRLPLKSSEKFELLHSQIKEGVISSQAPVLLFLDKLENLLIEIKGKNIEETKHELHKKIQSLDIAQSYEGDSLSVLTLNKIDEYLLIKSCIQEDAMKAKIEVSVAGGQLPNNWRSWEGSSEVSIAIPLTEYVDDFILYNFLPMGCKAKSPINAYLNGSFYTKSNRELVNEDMPLNAFLINQLQLLAVRAIKNIGQLWIKELDQISCIQDCIIDLLCWEKGYIPKLRDSFEKAGYESVINAKVIPAQCGKKYILSSLKDVKLWDYEDLEYIKRSVILGCSNAELITDILYDRGLESLQAFSRSITNKTIAVTVDEKSDLIEIVANSLKAKKKLNFSQWDAFYQDIAKIFKGDAKIESALSGKKFLLCQDMKLRGCYANVDENKHAPVFFHPELNINKTEGDGQFNIPASFKRYLAFMHPSLKWYEGRHGEQKDSRKFLSNIVKGYETAELLKVIQNVLTRTQSDRVRRDALVWIFKIHAKVDINFNFETLNLYVPVKSGWVPASKSYFSPKWNTVNAKLLHSLLTEVHDSTDLMNISNNLILPPAEWDIETNLVEKWRIFLQDIGVNDGLVPVKLEFDPGEKHGEFFQIERFANQLPLSEDAIAQYKRCQGDSDLRFVVNTKLYTGHKLKAPLYIIPGQGEYGGFSEAARKHYAILVARGVQIWDESIFFVTLQGLISASRQIYNYPTPCLSFLRYADWIPVRDCNRAVSEKYVSAKGAWLTGELESVPSFFPFVTHEFRGLLSIGNGKINFERLSQINQWNSERSLFAQIKKMAEIYTHDNISIFQLARFRHLYYESLLSIARSDKTSDTLSMNDLLILEKKGELIAVPISDLKQDDRFIYVGGEGDSANSTFLDTLECYVLKFRSKLNDKDVKRLIQLTGVDLKPISQIKPELSVNGQPFGTFSPSNNFYDFTGSWFKQIIVAIISEKARQIENGPIRQEKAGLLFDTLKVQVVDDFELLIDGQLIKTPSQYLHAFPYDWGEQRVIFLKKTYCHDFKCQLICLARALLYHLKLDYLNDSVELCLIKLLGRNDQISITQAPDVNEIALALNIDEIVLNEIFNSLGSSCEHFKHIVLPVVCYYKTIEEGYAFLTRLGPELTSEQVVNELVSELDGYINSSSDLKSLFPIDNMEKTYKKFQLNFGKFNLILQELGSPYQPILKKEIHDQVMDGFKVQEREKILGLLRLNYLHNFETFDDLNKYNKLKSMQDLTVDADWLMLYEEPTEELMWNRVSQWLDENSLATSFEAPNALDPLKDVRKANQQKCNDFQKRYAKLVYAHSVKNDSSLFGWSDNSKTLTSVFQLLDGIGCLDFRLLTDSEIAQWLAYVGEWDDSCVLSENLLDWGLSEDDCENATNIEFQTKVALKKEKNSILLDGVIASVEDEDYLGLAESVENSINDHFLNIGKNLTSLAEIVENSKTSVYGLPVSSQTHDSGSMNRNPKKLKAYGFAGELLAYSWLEKKYSNCFSEECWKSKMRNLKFGGDSGSDSLGYDFEIKMKSKDMYFEVKATVGDKCQIEMGETEIRAAQEYSSDIRRQFRILFITNVNDSEKRKLYVLPNPFSKLGRNCFKVVGTGIRYQFSIPS